MNEQNNDFQELRDYIEQHAPWFEILGVVEQSQPLLAVKDTSHCGLCVAFGSEADLACYLLTIGKGTSKQEPSCKERGPVCRGRESYRLKVTNQSVKEL